MTTTTDTTQTTPDTTATDANTSDTATTTSTTATAPIDGQVSGEGATGDTTTDTTGTEGDTSTDPATTEGDTPTQTDGAPETYEPFTLPEGVALEGDRLTQAQEFFRTQGWSQQRAQDVVDAYMQFRGDEHAAERGLWAEQSEQEFGSNFASITEGAQLAIVAVEKVRPGITARLDATNLGNHPDVLWLFSKFGELTRERPLIGLGGDGTTPEAPKSNAGRMFPHLP